MMYDGRFGGGVGLAELLILLLGAAIVFTAVVVLVVWFVRYGRDAMESGKPPAPPATDPALEIARQRLASGEITTEQFEEIKSALAP